MVLFKSDLKPLGDIGVPNFDVILSHENFLNFSLLKNIFDVLFDGLLLLLFHLGLRRLFVEYLVNEAKSLGAGFGLVWLGDLFLGLAS